MAELIEQERMFARCRRCIVPSNRHHWNNPPTFKNWQLNCPLKTVILSFLVALFRAIFTEENEYTRMPSISPLPFVPFPVRRYPSPSRSIHLGQGPTSGKRLTSLHCETRGVGEKIKRLLPVHCSGSSHVHYMNVAPQLVNWWRFALARFWHVCLEQNGRRRSHVFFTTLLEKVPCLLPNVPEIKEKQKKCLNLLLTALFKNTPILKFKSQLTFAFFAAVNHLSGPCSSLNFIRLPYLFD